MQVYKTLIIEKDGPIFRITFNRPEKKNAINQQYNDITFIDTVEKQTSCKQSYSVERLLHLRGLCTSLREQHFVKMCEEIICALNEAAKSDTLFTVLTGKGDYYCSGRDLSPGQIPAQNLEDYFKKNNELGKKHIAAYIDHPKPLIALVNGPAIGVAVTVLGLFDLVYASNKATFNTPFTSLGIVAEGCSTYTFPMLMGFSKASEMLMFGKKVTAEEACQRNLVTQVFPDKYFRAETDVILKRLSQLPPQSVLLSRDLIRRQHREKMREAKDTEFATLLTRYQSEERMNAMMKFLQSKSKL